MGIESVFYKTGHYSRYGYVRNLRVEADGKILGTIGRDTYLAEVIDRYILKNQFLKTNKKLYRKSLTKKQFSLLKFLMEASSKYWQLYEKALRKKWSMKELQGQLFWRLV